jgi:hypothetical protein
MCDLPVMLDPSSLLDADVDGSLHILGSDMQIKFTIEGFVSRVAKIAIAKDMPILVGLGDDEDPSQPSLKTWRIDANLEYPLRIDTILLDKGVAVRLSLSIRLALIHTMFYLHSVPDSDLVVSGLFDCDEKGSCYGLHEGYVACCCWFG